jgi:hypothetical protein
LKKIKKYFQKNLTNVNFFRTFAYIFKQRSLNNKKLSKKVGSANEPKKQLRMEKVCGPFTKPLPKGWFGLKTTMA